MNKILSYIWAIILLGILLTVSPLSIGTVDAAETEGVNVVKDLLKELEGKSKNFVSQNMYLEIYETVNNKPEETVNKKVAKKYGMTEEQIQNLIRKGNISVLKREEGVTLDQIQKQYTSIFNDFNEELAVENLRTELESDIKPSEIFKDGDTSNSDFDLLYDLSVIEVILFNEPSENEFGKDFDSPDLEDIDKEEEARIQELFDTAEAEEEEEIISEIQVEEGIEALECFEEDTSLEEAIGNFEKEEEAEQEGIAEEEDASLKISEEGIPKAPEHDWPKKYLCPDGAFFCIDISFDFASTSKSYAKTDNCIACHVQKINEELDKLLKKPLSPNKLTGDIFEVPKCKSAFQNVPANMKIITVAVPAPKQENNDLFVNTSIEKEWQKFNESFKPFWYEKTDKSKEEDLNKPLPSVTDRSVRKALSNAAPDATLNDVANRSANITDSIQKQTNENIQSKEKESVAENQNTFYQLILNELTTMNTYFNAMKRTFEKMKEPCNQTATKPNCT